MKSQRKYDFPLLDAEVDMVFHCEIDLSSLILPVVIMFMADKNLSRLEDLPRLVLICNPLTYEMQFRDIDASLLAPDEKELFQKMEIIMDEHLCVGEAILTTQEMAKLMSRGRKLTQWSRWPVIRIDEMGAQSGAAFIGSGSEDDFEECDCEACQYESIEMDDLGVYEEVEDEGSHFYFGKRYSSQKRHLKRRRRDRRDQ